MRVFLYSGLAGFHTEAAQLRPLPKAPLEFGEARETGQAEHLVPERDGFGLAGRRLITEPENATPAGGRKQMIGVPASLPVRTTVAAVLRARVAASSERVASLKAAKAASASVPDCARECRR